MQSGNYGHAVGDVDLTFNHSTKKLIVDKAQVITRDAIQDCTTAHPVINTIIAEATTAASVEGSVQFSTIPKTLHLGRNPTGRGWLKSWR